MSMTEPLPGDYRCETCGKWALAEHTFRTMLTCIYGGDPLTNGGTWDQGTSDEVVSKLVQNLGEGQ